MDQDALDELLTKLTKIEEMIDGIFKTHERLVFICNTALSLDGAVGAQLKEDALVAVVKALTPKGAA